MPALAQNERSSLNVLAVCEGLNTSFHRNNTGALVGVHAASETTITFDGFSANAVILKGHDIVIDGNTYSVTARGTSDGSGVVTDLAITPVIVGGGHADNEIVTVAKTKTFYWSESPFSTQTGDTPADEIFEPFLVVTKRFEMTMAQGNSFGKGFQLDSGAFELQGTKQVGSQNYVADLSNYTFAGRPVQQYIVGRLDDTSLTWSTKLTMLDGTVDQEPDWVPGRQSIPVRAKGARLVGQWQEQLEGFGEAPLFNDAGTTTAVIDNLVWNPGADPFTITTHLWRFGGPTGTKNQILYKSANIQLYYQTYKIHLSLTFTDVSTTVVSTSTLSDATVSAPMKIGAVLDRDLDEMRIYVNGELLGSGSCSSSDVADVSSDDLNMGGTGSVLFGEMWGTGLFDRALPADEVVNVLGAPIPGPATYSGLLAYWAGLMDAGATVMYDTGPDYDKQASPTSPWNATLTNCTRGHSLEGNADGRGTFAPDGWGHVRNTTPTPVDPSRNIFMFRKGPGGPVTAAKDRGGDLTLESDLSLEDFFTTTPTTNQVTQCSKFGLIRFGALVDGASVTVDYLGRGGSQSGYRLVRSATEHIEASSLNTDFNSSFTILFWLTMHQDDLARQQIFDTKGGSNDGWELQHVGTSSNPARLYLRVAGDGTEDIDLYTDKESVTANYPHHVAIAFIENDIISQTTVNIYLDGVLAATDELPSEHLQHPTNALSYGTLSGLTNFPADCTISELQIHNTGLSVTQIRDLMFRYSMADDITAGPTAPTYATNLSSYFPSPREAGEVTTTMIDVGPKGIDLDTGTNGSWVGGVAIGSTLHALWDLLSRSGGLTEDEIDTYDVATGIGFDDRNMYQSLISWEPDEAMTVSQVIEVVKEGPAMQVIFNAMTGEWLLRRVVDPDDLTAVLTVEQHEVDGKLIWGPFETPPSEVKCRWGMNSTVQQSDDLLESDTAVKAEHRLFAAKPYRFAQIPDSLNDEAFPTHDISVTINGIFFYEDDAAAAAIRQMEYRGRKIPIPRLIEIPLKRSTIGLTSVIPSEAIILNHEEFPDGLGTRQLLLLGLDASGQAGTLRGWG